MARIFGLAPENDEASLKVARERGPTRLLVRDAYLTEESKRELERAAARGGLYTEIKQEVFIPRLGGNANPRTTERVPAGARFRVEMTYRVLDELDEDYFGKYLLRPWSFWSWTAWAGTSAGGTARSTSSTRIGPRRPRRACP